MKYECREPGCQGAVAGYMTAEGKQRFRCDVCAWECSAEVAQRYLLPYEERDRKQTKRVVDDRTERKMAAADAMPDALKVPSAPTYPDVDALDEMAPPPPVERDEPRRSEPKRAEKSPEQKREHDELHGTAEKRETEENPASRRPDGTLPPLVPPRGPNIPPFGKEGDK